MRREEITTGFDPGHEKEGAQIVLEAHTQLRNFIAQEIAKVKSPNDYKKLGSDGPNVFKKLCAMRNDLVFGASAEKMAEAYPTFKEYGQRVMQRLWDTESYPSGGNGSHERSLNTAGRLLQDFLATKLGIDAQPKKKTQDELINERIMTSIVYDIRSRIKKGEVAEINSDRIVDEINRTAPEDRKYEKELYMWLRKLTVDKKIGVPPVPLKQSIPPEFQTDLDYLLHQLKSDYLAFEDVGEVIRKRRFEWRKEKVIREIVSKSHPETIAQKTPGVTTNSQAPEEEKENREKILEILESGEFPIIDLETDEIENFETLSKTIAQTYAKNYKVSEKDVFVEDANNIGGLKTEVIFQQNFEWAHVMGDPVSLEDMIPQTQNIKLVRISIKGQKDTKWRVLIHEKNEKLKLLSYKGKIFINEKPSIRMLNLEEEEAELYLMKKFPKIKDQDYLVKLIEGNLLGDTIHLLESDQGVIARVTTNKNGEAEYAWYELREMIETA